MTVLPGARTGRAFEEALLGRCGMEWDGEFLNFPKSIAGVVRNQPWPNPRKPDLELVNKLIRYMRRQLKGAGGPVLYFTAVGSPLDIFHGIDAFFLVGRTRISIDVTLNPKKKAYKADLILHPEDFEDLPRLASRLLGKFWEKRLKTTGS